MGINPVPYGGDDGVLYYYGAEWVPDCSTIGNGTIDEICQPCVETFNEIWEQCESGGEKVISCVKLSTHAESIAN